jgi:hypothetical protein
VAQHGAGLAYSAAGKPGGFRRLCGFGLIAPPAPSSIVRVDHRQSYRLLAFAQIPPRQVG